MQTQIIYSTDQEKSLTEHQLMLEKLFDKNQTRRRILAEFIETDLPFTQVMEEYEIPHTFGYDLLVQMVLHKRATPAMLVGAMRRHLGIEGTAKMLETCVEAELVTYDPKQRLFITNFDIPDEVQADIDRFQFPLPMVVEPNRLEVNTDTGRLDTKGSVILRDNHTDEDVCLDHLNRVNQIQFSINHRVVQMVKNHWKDLDHKKDDETQADYNRRCKAFDKFDRTAKDVITLITEISDKHFLTHRYDKRGRTYCMGYHVNYQGNPWNKAISELADKEITR